MKDTIRCFFDDQKRMHREGGPALFTPLGDVWYVHGRRTNTYQEYQQACGVSDEELTILKLKWGAMKDDQA